MLIDNIPAAQVPQALDAFAKIIKEFDLIIEIGTHKGGFAYWLFKNKKPKTRFQTYEINANFIEIPENDRSQMEIIISDCFNTICMEEMKSLITSSNRTLVLCDNGDKHREFITFSPFLKRNDVIMLHDYAHDRAGYTEIAAKHNWPAPPESWYSAIEEAVQQNGLLPYLYDEFRYVLWGSFIKN